LAVIGLGGLVLGLLEWPPLGLTHPLVVGSLAAGVVCLGVLIVVEKRASSPMMPLHLFRSRTFTLTNALTLMLYGALAVVMFLVPLVLIQVQGHSATEAGAALLPFAILMFAMSRWAGGLIKHVGARLPLTIGPAVAAVGIGLFALVRVDSSYWTTMFPAVCLLGLGMTITVAPLTTAVMGAVGTAQSGVASGINNSVSRVAGLLAIAVFGVLFARTFDARMHASLDRAQLSPESRAAIEKELPKMAGAEITSLPMDPNQRARTRRAIDEAFIGGFRVVVIGSALLALAGAGFGAGIAERKRGARA
jgi:hypothetical protein